MFDKTESISLPSGLTIVGRALAITEANIMADDSSNQKRSKVFDAILTACTKEVVEAGPYKPDAHGKIGWSKVLLGDRFAALMAFRRLTWGNDFDFKILKCEHCRKPFSWTVPLDGLEVRPLPQASVAKIAAGDNRFETTLPETGQKVTFQLVTGEMERNASKLAEERPDERVSLSLATRVLSIEGVDAKDRVTFLSRLPMPVGMGLIDLMDTHDCGVETTIEVEHQIVGCGATMEVEIPFGARTYWMPRRKS